MGDAAEKTGEVRPTMRCEAPTESEVRLSRFRWNDQIRGLTIEENVAAESAIELAPLMRAPVVDEDDELPVSSSPTMPVPVSVPFVETPGGVVVHPRLESILARIFVDDDDARDPWHE